MARKLHYSLLLLAPVLCMVWMHIPENAIIKTLNLKISALESNCDEVPHHSTKYELQEVRLQRLKQFCKGRNRPDWPGPKPYQKACLAYPPRKIIVCSFPKAGCSSWKTVMVAATEKFGRKFPQWKDAATFTKEMRDAVGMIHDLNFKSYNLIAFGYQSYKKFGDKFRDYFKVIVVRDPYERLISAYHDKIEGAGEQLKLAKYEKLRAILEVDTPDIRCVSTFSDFINYVIEELKVGHANQHWAPFWQLFDPCFLDFDFIVKLETIKQDAPMVLSHLFDRKFALLSENSNSKHNSTDKHTYYKAVGQKNLQTIKDYFADDFSAFGYNT